MLKGTVQAPSTQGAMQWSDQAGMAVTSDLRHFLVPGALAVLSAGCFETCTYMLSVAVGMLYTDSHSFPSYPDLPCTCQTSQATLPRIWSPWLRAYDIVALS